MNKALLLGRITRDVELKTTKNGTNVCVIDLALKDGEEETTYISITAFNKIAETIAKYLAKGSLIACNCKIKNNNYTDKNGKKIYSYKFIAEKVTFLSSKNKAIMNNEEELPFE